MILDTNALSAFFEEDIGLLSVLDRGGEDLHLPVIVLGEYRYGLTGSRIRDAADALLTELERQSVVLQIDSGTSRSYAAVRRELREAGTPIPENDVWIAALARQHRLVLVSRDTHFDAVAGMTRLSWGSSGDRVGTDP